MKSVVMIAYSFPPEGNGVRTAHFGSSDAPIDNIAKPRFVLETAFYERFFSVSLITTSTRGNRQVS